VRCGVSICVFISVELFHKINVYVGFFEFFIQSNLTHPLLALGRVTNPSLLCAVVLENVIDVI
jgi:hypothetical protein